MRPLTALITLCERLANRPDLPARVVDWASNLYDALSNKAATVRTEDLWILQVLGEDEQQGLFVLDAALARRHT
jgi:hypothetical protein